MPWNDRTKRRLKLRDLVPLIPFAMLSAIAAGWTIWEQKFHSGANGADWQQSWPERFIVAGRVIWFYLGKLIWPAIIERSKERVGPMLRCHGVGPTTAWREANIISRTRSGCWPGENFAKR